MNERRSLQLLAEQYDEVQSNVIVYVAYSMGDVCSGDMMFTKAMNVGDCAEHFYKDSNFVEYALERTQLCSAQFNISPFKWYFPTTKEEFIQRLVANKPIIFESSLDEQVFPLTDNRFKDKDLKHNRDLFLGHAYYVICSSKAAAGILTRRIFDSMEDEE